MDTSTVRPVKENWWGGMDFRDVFFIDENHGWIVGDNGTVFATRDGGSVWESQVVGVTENLTSVFFIDENIGWVVGEYGRILTTLNGGQTWHPRSSKTRNTLGGLSFVDKDKGWIVTAHQTIMATVDGGSSWAVQHSARNVTLFSTSFVDGLNGWAVGYGGRILATQNGGLTWVSQNSRIGRNLLAVDFVNQCCGWAVGWHGSIVFTTDSGSTWNSQPTSRKDNLLSVDFVDDKHGWVVGNSGLVLATRDGGFSWNVQESGVKETLWSVRFLDSEQGWIVGSSGVVLHTLDGGDSWTRKGFGCCEDLVSAHFVDELRAWAVNSQGELMMSNDRGTSWNPVPLKNEHRLSRVYFFDRRNGWAVSRGGELSLTKDGGSTWTVQDVGRKVHPNSFHFVSETLGWVLSKGGRVLATENGGLTWKVQTSRKDGSLQFVHFVTEDKGWAVGNNGRIIATANGGSSWEPQDSGTEQFLVAVHFVDIARGWAVGSDGTILSTRDGGTSWIQQISSTDYLLQDVHFVDQFRGWAVGGGGTIITTQNGGANWALQNSGVYGALSSVSFSSREIGWISGSDSFLKFGGDKDSSPVISRFRAEDHQMRISWVVEDDGSSDLIGSNIEYRIGDGGWREIREPIERTIRSSTSADFTVVWDPRSDQYRAGSDRPLYYRITLHDGAGNEFIQDIQVDGELVEFWIAPLAERLAEGWEWLGRSVLGKALQVGLIVLVLGLLYIVVLSVLLVLRPSALLWLPNLRVSDLAKESGPTRWTGLLLEILVTASLTSFLAVHRRTRRAWLSKHRVDKTSLDTLAPRVREAFLREEEVLDAWVAQEVSGVQERFLAQRLVRDRKVHVDMPVQLDERLVESLGPLEIMDAFDSGRSCLLIWGAGGSGKTSLACRIARWAMAGEKARRIRSYRMLPVLIDHETQLLQGEDDQGLRRAVQGQIEVLTGASEPIPEDLLDALLRRKRILVIVDSFSVMSEAARARVRPDMPGFPAHALLVTARRREYLGGVPGMTLRPLLVKGNRLSSFMEAYLSQAGERDRFEDPEFFAACRRLSLLVGDRHGTVLLAKLYAEQMILASETGESLPSTIPDLFLSYMNQLNRHAGEGALDNRTVQNAAKVIAWECVRDSLQSSTARLTTVEASLGGEEVATPLVLYLCDRLGVIEVVVPSVDRVKFTLDPLAEYLAGFFLVENFGGDNDKWESFFVLASGKEVGEVREFLLATSDCCRAWGAEFGVPEWVFSRLTSLTDSPARPDTKNPLFSRS